MHCSTEEQDIEGSVACGETIVGNTIGAGGSVGIAGGDHLYSFTVEYARLVQFSSCLSSYDTSLRVMSANLDNELSSSEDSGLCADRAVLDADMMPGDYILVIGGDTGSCLCSGERNSAFEGADCQSIDAWGAWCYTERGACGDGAPSSSVAGADYSYVACLPGSSPQLEGEYDVTMLCPGDTGFLDGTIQCGQTVTDGHHSASNESRRNRSGRPHLRLRV